LRIPTEVFFDTVSVLITFASPEFNLSERLRSSVATSIKNSQIICSHDVSSLCFEGRSVNADSDAVSLWTEKHYKRKQYTHFDEVRRWPTVSIIYSFLWLTQNLCLLLVRFVDLR